MSDINELMVRARELRDEKDELNQGLKDLNKALKEIDSDIRHYLENNGLDKLSAAGSTAVLTKKKVASVGDWDAFFSYVADHQAWHLLQRRVSNNAAVESIETLGDEIPSVTVEEFSDLGFRRG